MSDYEWLPVEDGFQPQDDVVVLDREIEALTQEVAAIKVERDALLRELDALTRELGALREDTSPNPVVKWGKWDVELDFGGEDD